MSDGNPAERHCDDSQNGGDKEKKENKNEEEAYNENTYQNMVHGTPQEHPDDDQGGSESPSVVVTGGDDDNCSNAQSSSAYSMAKGLSSFISSVMEDYDSTAEATTSSQNQLTFALDRLTGELDQLLDDAPLPFIMQHAARISGVRKRVKSLNLVLRSIQRRIDNIDGILSTGSVKGNPGPKT